MRPETQLAAWQEVQDELPEKRRIVFQMIARHERGVTLFQLVNLLNWPVNSISGRLTELERSGRIEDSGTREVNPATGKRAIVWRVRQAFHFDDRGQGDFYSA